MSGTRNEIPANFLGITCEVQEFFLFLQRCLKMKSKNMRANSMKRKSLKVWLLIVVLMQQGQDDLLQMVNNVIRQMKSDGSLRKLHEKYGLVYAYE